MEGSAHAKYVFFFYCYVIFSFSSSYLAPMWFCWYIFFFLVYQHFIILIFNIVTDSLLTETYSLFLYSNLVNVLALIVHCLLTAPSSGHSLKKINEICPELSRDFLPVRHPCGFAEGHGEAERRVPGEARTWHFKKFQPCCRDLLFSQVCFKVPFTMSVITPCL